MCGKGCGRVWTLGVTFKNKFWQISVSFILSGLPCVFRCFSCGTAGVLLKGFETQVFDAFGPSHGFSGARFCERFVVWSQEILFFGLQLVHAFNKDQQVGGQTDHHKVIVLWNSPGCGECHEYEKHICFMGDYRSLSYSRPSSKVQSLSAWMFLGHFLLESQSSKVSAHWESPKPYRRIFGKKSGHDMPYPSQSNKDINHRRTSPR